MGKSDGFAECTACNVWSDIPTSFNESKQFAQCPKCLGPMYLLTGLSPKDVALKDSNKVAAGTMPQSGAKGVKRG